MLSEQEEQQLLTGFNDTSTPYPFDKTVVELFEEQVAKTPNAVALVMDEQHLTYQQLNEKSNQLAHYLKEKGLAAESLVPICIERSVEMIIGVLAILKAGCTYVPIDPEYPQERIRYMLQESAAKIVLSTMQSHKYLAPPEDVRIIQVDQQWSVIASQPFGNLPKDSADNGDNLIYVLYTSGSTGKPKGVKMPNNGMVNLLLWQQKQFQNKNRRVLQFASLNFDVSFQEIFSTLCFGNTLYLIESDRRVEMAEVYRDIQRYSLTHLFLPVVVLQNLCEFIQLQGDKEFQVEEIITAGEQLKLTDDIRKVVTQKGVRLVNQYGPTEAHVVSSFTLDENSPLPALPPIGKPIENTRLYVLSKGGQLVPVGVAGELYIGGVQVAQGYLNNAELTAERFVPDCFNGEGRGHLYRTGDLARWLPDGNIEYLGRIDDQFKIRGYRVEPAEIESVLQHCSFISQAVVMIREDSMSQKQLVGYVVPNGEFNREGVIAYLKLYLPEYMIPHVWMELEHLPLTNNGKVNRKALPKPKTVESDQYVAPRTEVERVLAEVWKELLHLDKVGVHDNFFELGGHSLMAMRVTAAIRREMMIEVTLKDLFHFSTVAALSRYIEVQKAMYSQEKDLSEFEIVNI
jgi:amino acid adenylation domain-containing protein